MQKGWASVELARLVVTGSTDPLSSLSHFQCQLCQLDVSLLTQGLFEILWHYQGAKYSTMYQRMRLETTDWRVVEFGGNPMPDEKVERQRAKIMRTLLVRRDREKISCQNSITDDTGVVDPHLPMLAKVSSPLEVLRLGGSYELMEQLCAQFSLTVSCVNIGVCLLRIQVLVSFRICCISNTYRFLKITFLFHILCTDFCLQSFLLNRRFPRIVSHVVSCVKSCGQFGVEFEEGSEATLVFVRTWDRDTFRKVCVAVLRRYSGEASCDAAALGHLLSSSVSPVCFVGGSHVFCIYIKFAGKPYREKLVKYSFFRLATPKEMSPAVCLSHLWQFGPVFFKGAHRGAEHRDWVADRHALRRAVVSGDFSMPSLVEVVGNLVGYWPLIVSYLKETGRRNVDDNFVVQFTSWDSLTFVVPQLMSIFLLEESYRWILIQRSDGTKTVLAVSSDSRDL